MSVLISGSDLLMWYMCGSESTLAVIMAQNRTTQNEGTVLAGMQG